MSIPFSEAMKAYSSMSNIGGIGGAQQKIGGLGGGVEGGSPMFGNMVTDSINGFIQQGQKAETNALQATTGKANIVDAVTSLSETELQLQTLVTVRDKVIEAYNQIMNMPV